MRRQMPAPGRAMRMRSVNRFDLNLFSVLAALQECGSVSGAARAPARPHAGGG